jgi:hypothetical protein
LGKIGGLMCSYQDLQLLLEFDKELQKVLNFKAALLLATKLQKPFKFSEKAKAEMIKDVIAAIKKDK